LTFHPEDGTAEPNTLVAVEGKENSLPSTINLPISAKNVSYEVKINLASQEERLAVIDEKKLTAGQKAAEAGSKRIQSYIILGVMVSVFFLCLYVIFLAPVDEGRRQFAEKMVLFIVAFLTGNAVPKLLSEGEDKKKD
jgi:hypothetical protein